MRVRFWGVRGSFPVPGPTTNRFGGNTSCVQVCPDDGSTLILDGGTGIRRLGQRLMAGPCGKGRGAVHLLISHTHWDHIQGIPFFAPLYVAGNTIHIYARQRDVDLRTIFASQTKDPYFPVSLDDVAAEVRYTALRDGGAFQVGDATIRCARLNHPFIAMGYRVEADGGAMTYVSDTAPFDRILFGQQFIAGKQELDTRLPAADAQTLRAIRRGVLELCRGCDLLIYDTMFRMHEYLARPHWGHSSPEHAVEIAREAGAAALALFHHAPDRSDEEVERDVEQTRRIAPCEVFAAQEGLERQIGGPAGGEGRRCS